MSDCVIKQRILIVEESATLRYMLGKVIKKQGYDLISVGSFEAAIELLQSSIQDLHAILVGWPNYDHFEHTKNLLLILDREPYSEIPVILISNDTEVDLFNWMSTRQTTALVTWENYQEVTSSLQSMLNPDASEPVIEKRKARRDEKPTRILLVDDERSIREPLAQFLQNNYLPLLQNKGN